MISISSSHSETVSFLPAHTQLVYWQLVAGQTKLDFSATFPYVGSSSLSLLLLHTDTEKAYIKNARYPAANTEYIS